MDVAVVGGGLAGLVAARRLARADYDVDLFESTERLGGRVHSTQRGGYVFDRGFQVLFTAYPAAKRELDFEALDLRRYAPGAIICRRNHRATVADPLRDPVAAVETAFGRDLTLGDKLRVLRLRLRLRRRSLEAIFDAPDEPIETYLRGLGFSEKFIDRFARPFYGGITLDRSLSTSKRVFEFTFKMLASGDIAVPADGMGAIGAQLAARARDAGVGVNTGTEVTAVSGTTDGASVTAGGERFDVDAAVVATDAAAARSLTGVGAIPSKSNGCTTQYYRLSGSELGTGRRLLLNAGDGEGPNEIAPVSEVAPEHAPADETIVSATYLGVPDADDDELAARTRQALAAWYPGRSFADLEPLQTARVPFAQFAQPPGIHEELPDTRTPTGRVYLAGEYTRNSSINGALQSGRRAAVAVDADLT